MRLVHKVETYNSDTQHTHVLGVDTVGTYKSSGTREQFISAKKFGDDDARLGGSVSTTRNASSATSLVLLPRARASICVADDDVGCLAVSV